MLRLNSCGTSDCYVGNVAKVSVTTIAENRDGRSKNSSVAIRCRLNQRLRSGELQLEDDVKSYAPIPISADAGLRVSAHYGTNSVQPRFNCEKSLSQKQTMPVLYLVDVHPLCYDGSKARPTALLRWMDLLLRQIANEDPVIAVMDGERGNDYRKKLLPGYKGNRSKFLPSSGWKPPAVWRSSSVKHIEIGLHEALPCIRDFLVQCNVPVVKVEDAEADDVLATLVQQAVGKGMKVIIASPDMDFRQLLAENVHMVLPLPEFGRWSFYTLNHYIAQHTCDPSLELGLRCMLGDASDCIPGLLDLAPGFGRKTALKLIKKHGTLENLLTAAKARTVGKPYIQAALTQHAEFLRRNLKVLSFRRDIDILLKDEWCIRRDIANDAGALKKLTQDLRT